MTADQMRILGLLTRVVRSSALSAPSGLGSPIEIGHVQRTLGSLQITRLRRRLKQQQRDPREGDVPVVGRVAEHLKSGNGEHALLEVDGRLF